jgi:hypothetical protein
MKKMKMKKTLCGMHSEGKTSRMENNWLNRNANVSQQDPRKNAQTQLSTKFVTNHLHGFSSI